MLVEHTLFGEINKVDIAIKRLQEFEPQEGYLLAFSGGKDSQVVYHLAEMAGVKFRAEVAPTPDPPELIRFRRKYYPDVIERKCNVFTKRQVKGTMEGRPKTIFNLISSKKQPPTRMQRYCCEELKENVGNVGDTVLVGVRWSESNNRKKLSMVSFWKGKVMVRPIIDWTDEDVWEFLKKYKKPYCELYDQGFTRIGCIGCPLSSNQEKELEMYPKYKENYIRAFNRMIKNLDNNTTWQTGEDVMEWWIGKCKEKPLENQCSMFEE
ncbi:phosphoadenosine phosphosulfate reductase family protein [Niameybacter massiliensis]|uniref:phosphoadenosine phosphosulfate reductase family protein n=1 Tax=Niameybacter massiliensis TaxID=1658108 RepID=UPI0006B51FA1|nr:phosphoadenosine phosphosulfate reductase family protein [Niameybacter massiliensis]